MTIDSDNIRKGITKADFNKENSNYLYTEVLIISVVSGLYSNSWIVFGVVLFALILGLNSKKISIFISIVLSIGWAVVGFFLGGLFESIEASIVLAIIGLVAGIGIHASARQWLKDLVS